MELPLLERMQQFDLGWPLTAPAAGKTIGSLCGVGSASEPLPVPGPGEQYRFHFDMAKCIGCKCCVVACNEQNGNPADILWRRVGEIEGGTYPATQRHYLSMGCNHCLEPTCMTGCPVNAYAKDSVTGIVRHNADACIGCQYCTWNCSYGVPQYNPERGVVGKCDMCYGRLMDGESPACVSACPEDAIQIELVSVKEWRQQYKSHANSPGMPSADDSISTTRITRPLSTPSDLRNVNLGHLHIEDAHWPLIMMTVLTQLSVGAFSAIWVLQTAGAGTPRVAGFIALMAALAALSASTLHLGRPIHAVRALKMWRRSWLSREVLLFSLFAVAATVYSIALFTESRLAFFAGAVTILFGVAGVGASARLYLAPGRPAWNSPVTFLEFFATTALLGVAGASFLAKDSSAFKDRILLTALGTALVIVIKLARLGLSGRYELYGSWQLLSTVLLNKVMLRAVLLLVAACLAAFGHDSWVRICGMSLLIAGEFLGRYLFFVSVVPTNMATGYLMQEAA